MAFVILVSLDNLLYQRMSYHVLAGQIAEGNIVYVFQHLLCHIQSRFGYLPEATQTALQDALAAYGEDRNGDGKVVVKLNVYTMNFGSDDSDAYLDMAGTTKLSTDIQGALSSIFILYDPAGFQSTTGTLRYLDGSLPQSDADNDWWNMVYHWDDCPVLAGLDLGDYTSDAVQNDSGSSQELLSHYYIGIRGAWTKDADGLLSDGEALWQALTAGAVSTVTKEG